jgi:hypothetical protein
MTTNTVPRGTSWMSVLGGWIAAVGAGALVAPGVAGFLAVRAPTPSDLALAVPVIVGLMVSYLIGGYVGGRMAGYHTSWHGMMTAFFGLFVMLVVLMLAGLGLIPNPSGWDPSSLGETLTLGAILGFLATIFAGWLGGVLAPGHLVVAAAPVEPRDVPIETVEPSVPTYRPGYRILPAVGQKGGETVTTTTETEVRETKVD